MKLVHMQVLWDKEDTDFSLVLFIRPCLNAIKTTLFILIDLLSSFIIKIISIGNS